MSYLLLTEWAGEGAWRLLHVCFAGACGRIGRRLKSGLLERDIPANRCTTSYEERKTKRRNPTSGHLKHDLAKKIAFVFTPGKTIA
jgi:hypothetical protein